MSLTPSTPCKPRRTPRTRRAALTARAHVLADRLGYDEPCRRNVQAALTGCRSCLDMTLEQLEALVAQLETFDAERRLTRPRHDEPVSDDEALEILGMAA